MASCPKHPTYDGAGPCNWNCRGCRAVKKQTPTAPPRLAQASTGDSITEKGNERTVTTRVSRQVESLPDLLRVLKVDTTEWFVKEWSCGKYEMGSLPRPIGNSKDGWRQDDDTPRVTELFTVRAVLKRVTPEVLELRALREQLLADIREDNRHPRKWPAFTHVRDGFLFEFTPFDLHMGKYTWDEETVTNFDVDIAERLFDAAADFSLRNALKLTDGKLERILVVFGNDVSHVDNRRGETSGGTRMEAYDSRLVRVFRRIVRSHRRVIDHYAQHAPVDVIVVSGNHDAETSFYLGEILAAIYEGDPRVTVDNGAKLRKYYEFGDNLFGFTHGDAEKVSELGLTMAREQPEMWARCGSREWHIGHKHIAERHEHKARFEQDLHSDKGVRVRRLASLSAHDAWHTKHAYMDRRACDSFVFHKTAGFTANLSFNVDHFTGKALTA